MGNRPDDQIDRSVIIKIVKERLIQKGEKEEILNSLIKLGYSKHEANEIIKESIKELINMGILLKSNKFVHYILVFLLIVIIICFYFIFK